MFRVKFKCDEQKLQDEIQNGVNTFNNNYLRSDTVSTEKVVEHFNIMLAKAFTNCKVKGGIKKSTPDWKSQDSKAIWDRIDWSGKTSSSRSYDKPDDDETFKLMKDLYTPKDEPPVEEFVIGSQVYMPITDDVISMREIQVGFEDQKSGYNFSVLMLFI